MSSQNWRFFTPCPLLVVFLSCVKLAIFALLSPYWDDIVYGQPLTWLLLLKRACHKEKIKSKTSTAMMILKLILPTICLVLLVRPVISDIGNKWTKTVSDIEDKLFKPEFTFRNPIGTPVGGKEPRSLSEILKQRNKIQNFYILSIPIRMFLTETILSIDNHSNLWKNLTTYFISFYIFFFEFFLIIPNDKYTCEGQKFILCFIICSLLTKSTIKLKLFDVAISVNFWCHNPSLIESPSV